MSDIDGLDTHMTPGSCSPWPARCLLTWQQIFRFWISPAEWVINLLIRIWVQTTSHIPLLNSRTTGLWALREKKWPNLLSIHTNSFAICSARRGDYFRKTIMKTEIQRRWLKSICPQTSPNDWLFYLNVQASTKNVISSLKAHIHLLSKSTHLSPASVSPSICFLIL